VASQGDGAAKVDDVFVIHAEGGDDQAFVNEHLLPALDGLSVGLSSSLPLGRTVVTALVDGVVKSRVTVVVVSLAFLQDSWSNFGEELASHHAVSDGLLVPVLIEECPLPLRLGFRVRLDCRDRATASQKLMRLRELLHEPAPSKKEIPCPYPGMRPFSEVNANLFYGRSAEIRDLSSRIAGGRRELYVFGSSGSGKSSLLRAGVLPRLQQSNDPVIGEPFVTRVIRPDSLAAEVLSNSPSRHVVVIDQLEEIFTIDLEQPKKHREVFAQIALLRKDPRVHLVFAMRIDFLDQLKLSELWPFVQRGYRIDLAPLQGNELREAIEKPAQTVGVAIERSLVERLLVDSNNEPGVLPLLQEVLIHLWSEREGSVVRESDYQALGNKEHNGLGVALARHADTTFANLDERQQLIAQRIFLRLVSFGRGQVSTRRQQRREALTIPKDAELFDPTLRHLIDHRLLTAGVKDTIDLAHEVLISAWPRLEALIEQYVAEEQFRRDLEARAYKWSKRPPAKASRIGLLDTGEVNEAHKWLSSPAAEVVGASDVLRLFLQKSRVAIESRRRWLLVALMVVALVMTSLSVYAFGIARKEERAATDARQLLAAVALREADTDPTLALYFAERAGEYKSDVYADLAMLRAFNAGSWLYSHRLDSVRSADLSDDGRYLVWIDVDFQVHLDDLTSGEKSLLTEERYGETRFLSPDRILVWTEGGDSPAAAVMSLSGEQIYIQPFIASSPVFCPGGSIVLLVWEFGRIHARLLSLDGRKAALLLPAHLGMFLREAECFSVDGGLAILAAVSLVIVQPDGRVITAELPGPINRRGLVSEYGNATMAVDRVGRRAMVYVSDGKGDLIGWISFDSKDSSEEAKLNILKMGELRGAESLSSEASNLEAADSWGIGRFLPDGRVFIASEARMSIVDLDARTIEQVGSQHASNPARIEISPEGDRLAVMLRSGVVMLYSQAGVALAQLLGHHSDEARRRVYAKFNQEGTILLTVGGDGARIWQRPNTELMTFIAQDHDEEMPSCPPLQVSRREDATAWKVCPQDEIWVSSRLRGLCVVREGNPPLCQSPLRQLTPGYL
jgi:TIR domain